MEKQRALPKLNPARCFRHLCGGQGRPGVGTGGHGVLTRPQPQADTHTVTPVPEELHLPRCEHHALAMMATVTTSEALPRRQLGEGTQRCHISHPPYQRSPTGSSLLHSWPPAPAGCLLSRETCSRGGRRHMVPSSSSPWLRHASPLASANRALASQRGSLGRGSVGQAKPSTPSHGCRMWGRRGPSPTRWHQSWLLGGGEGPGEWNTSQDRC